MPALPTAGDLPARVPRRASGMVERAGAGIRRSGRLAGDRRFCSRKAWCQPYWPTFHRRLRRRPALRDSAQVRTGRRRISRRSERRFEAKGCGDPQRSEMLSARQQAGAGRDQDVQELLRSCSGSLPKVRVLLGSWPDRPRRRCSRARPSADDDQIRTWRRGAAPDGRLLLSSYHCSRYNQNTGRLDAHVRGRVRARCSLSR